MTGLDRRAALDVAQHRGGNRGTDRSEHAVAALDRGIARLKPILRGDRTALVEHGAGQLACATGGDVAEGATHQAADAGRGGDESPTSPGGSRWRAGSRTWR